MVLMYIILDYYAIPTVLQYLAGVRCSISSSTKRPLTPQISKQSLIHSDRLFDHGGGVFAFTNEDI